MWIPWLLPVSSQILQKPLPIFVDSSHHACHMWFSYFTKFECSKAWDEKTHSDFWHTHFELDEIVMKLELHTQPGLFIVCTWMVSLANAWDFHLKVLMVAHRWICEKSHVITWSCVCVADFALLVHLATPLCKEMVSMCVEFANS